MIEEMGNLKMTIMKRLATFIVAFVATLGATAQISDDILDSLVNDVQHGKAVSNVEMAEIDESTAYHRLLAVGDDMLEAIGPRLYNYACTNGYSIFTEIWQGSTVESWAYTTELPRLIKKLNPTYVIICLGTNDLTQGNPAGKAAAVAEIIREIGDVPLVWIGPLEMKSLQKDPGVTDMLRQQVGANRFFNSYNLRVAREDEVRPTAEGGARWMDEVAKWMSSLEVAAPIKMDIPTASLPFKKFVLRKNNYQGKRK